MRPGRSTAPAKRILVVDDHPIMRLGLQHLLEQEPGLEACGEAANATEALLAVQRLHPDLILLDISLSGRSGLDLLKDLKAMAPEIPVLVHSMHDEAIYAERALRNGARGYLMKQETGVGLVEAVRQVLKGEIYLSKAMRARSRKKHRAEQSQTPVGALTSREFEVFQLIGRGMTNPEIARALHISVRTVEAHREHIKRKLDLGSSTALNLLAVRWESEQAA